MEPSTYTQCFTGAAISQDNWRRRCHSIDHATDACPIKPMSMPRKREGQQLAPIPPLKKRLAPHSNPQTCRKYNTYDGDCRYGANCMFQHKCESCGDHGHPVTKCPKVKRMRRCDSCRKQNNLGLTSLHIDHTIMLQPWL